MRFVTGAVASRNENIQMAADGVGRLVFEDLFRAAIEMNDALRSIDRDDRIGGDSQNSRELRFRFAKRVLDLALGTKPTLDDPLSEQYQTKDDADKDKSDRQRSVLHKQSQSKRELDVVGSV